VLVAHERAGHEAFVPAVETRATIYVTISVIAAFLFSRTAAILRALVVGGPRGGVAAGANRRRRCRKAEARLELVLESGGHSLWDWDGSRQRVERSPLLATALGFGPEKISADPDGLSGLLHPDDVAVLQAWRAALDRPGQTDHSTEVRLRTSAGEWRWFAIAGRVMERGPDGKATRALGTHTDITKLKQAEDGLRLLNLELEHRVAVRTVELQARTEEALKIRRRPPP